MAIRFRPASYPWSYIATALGQHICTTLCCHIWLATARHCGSAQLIVCTVMTTTRVLTFKVERWRWMQFNLISTIFFGSSTMSSNLDILPNTDLCPVRQQERSTGLPKLWKTRKDERQKYRFLVWRKTFIKTKSRSNGMISCQLFSLSCWVQKTCRAGQ